MLDENKINKLVDRIKSGDKQAEQLFCKEFYNSTLHLIRRLVREPMLAEDLTHETLLTVLLKLREGKLRHSKFLNQYVQQTARYTAISWYRRKANQVHTQLEESMFHDNSPSAEELIFDDERRLIVVHLLNSLGVERDREILDRHYLKEEEKPGICKEKNLSSEHFDRVISRARIRCRELVARKGSDQFVLLLSGT
jgi:RNA polymerase sigma factor (sigma-70 family)